MFQMHAGINVLAPPYDFTLETWNGSNKPSLQKSIASGVFGVVGTANAGSNFSGVAGIALFVIPSAPAKALSIRPYFLYDYNFSCHSTGTPTAHSHGALGADVSGRIGTSAKPFPGKALHLWSGSSDAWRDETGNDADAFRNPFSELIVSGCDYYTLQYTCHADGDSGSGLFGYSIAYVRLHCRVPFIVVEEF
jgi:hypothetical protein